MKKLIIALNSLLMSLNAFSNSVFTFKVRKDILLLAAALIVFASPFLVENIPANVPTNLDENNINPLDRGIIFSYNETLDNISDYGVYALLVLPIISLAGNRRDKKAWMTYGIMYGEAFALTFGIKDLIKNAIIRYRPYMYTGTVSNGLLNDYFNSFPSGSTALAFLAAGFLTATFSAEYPKSKWKISIITGIHTLAVGTATVRIISGSHFLTDVIVGAVIGSIFGWVIPLLHKKNNNENIISNQQKGMNNENIF
jgi:undecaprenyl-diphosphatase